MTAAYALRERWQSMIGGVCHGALSDASLREILNLLLSDEDDPQLVAEGWLPDGPPPPVPTPVERLLRFVRQALGRLRQETENEMGRFTVDQRPQLVNLARLLEFVLDDDQRALSRLEKIQLFSQWSSLALYRDLLDPSNRPSAWSESDERLSALENLIQEVRPTEVLAVDQLRAWLIYRRAVTLSRKEPTDHTNAAAGLKRLLVTFPHLAVPSGLYYRAARELLRLPRELAGPVLQAARRPLALAFATASPARILDRLGICLLLGQDALWTGAPVCARRFAEAATQLADVSPAAGHSLPPATERLVAMLRHEFAGYLQDLLADVTASPEPPGFDRFMNALTADVAAALKRDLHSAYEALRASASEEPDTGTALYAAVLRSWISRKLDEPPGEVERPAFLEQVEAVIGGPLRDDAAIARLALLGHVSRMLRARGALDVDRTLTEFDTVLSTAVLVCDRQMLVDTLGAWGHHNRLERLGLHAESLRLQELKAYFERAFGLTVRSQDALAFQGVYQDLTGAVAVDVAGLRVEADALQNRWRWQDDVMRWATSYQLRHRRPLFVPNSLDPKVQEFFVAADRVSEVASLARRIDVKTERLAVLASLAWCAAHFSKIFRTVGQATSAEEWRTRGISWVDEAIDLARTYRQLPSLYRCLEAKIRLLPGGGEAEAGGSRERLRLEMLTLDVKQLSSIRTPGRRHRSVLKASRTLSEIMSREWCRSHTAAYPLSEIREWFDLLQALKTFNYAQLAGGEPSADGDAEPFGDDAALADDAVVPEHGVPDVFERLESYGRELMTEEALRGLAHHLEDEQAAILEYLTHPDLNDFESRPAAVWQAHVGRGRGTICLLITGRNGELWVQPTFLDVPESLVRTAVYGDPRDTFQGRAFDGLISELPTWLAEPPSRMPASLRNLGRNLFPEALLTELSGINQLYVCPHRHLFQVPVHALETSAGQPLFQRWNVMYAMKTSHIARLLTGQQRSGDRLWALVDTSDASIRQLGVYFAGRLGNWNNHWGERGVSTDDLLAQASEADRVLILCHGQMDPARAGRARLRLWGGGRILADDIHRVRSDYGRADWIVVACDAGFARVGMQTGPGLALSLVTSGASRVTCCLYRVTTSAAREFVAAYLRRADTRSEYAFTAACRDVSRDRSLAGWGLAAAFVSYGLLSRAG